MVRGLDEKARNRLVSQLEMPLKGETPDDGVWAPEAMGSAFEQAMAATSAEQGRGAGDQEPADPAP